MNEYIIKYKLFQNSLQQQFYSTLNKKPNQDMSHKSLTYSSKLK